MVGVPSGRVCLMNTHKVGVLFPVLQTTSMLKEFQFVLAMTIALLLTPNRPEKDKV